MQRAASAGHGAGDSVGVAGEAVLELRWWARLLQYLVAGGFVGLPLMGLGGMRDASSGQHEGLDGFVALQWPQRQQCGATQG